MLSLNINIDHVATLRQARGGVEPDPVIAAGICELAGAEGIVCHLREDRRHAQDRDVRLLKEIVQSKFDLEMAASEEIIKIALDVIPDMVTIVPEKRAELTTEGGLNVAADIEKYKKLSDRFHEKGIEVSYFVEPTKEQMDAVLNANGDMVELHTGTYANLKGEAMIPELQRIIDACEYASSAGLKIAAGHGLNYTNTKPIAKIPQIGELSIGHSVMARAIFVGLERAVKEMLALMK
ncbi:MAG: pyridoxine 5'-phosphate synthase [Bacteroidetes bacterium 4572_77]|nr:MAG: pyridoxine 5'-phosphate synthase [Bacteroidetes bacterium 4572_77]